MIREERREGGGGGGRRKERRERGGGRKERVREGLGVVSSECLSSITCRMCSQLVLVTCPLVPVCSSKSPMYLSWLWRGTMCSSPCLDLWRHGNRRQPSMRTFRQMSRKSRSKSKGRHVGSKVQDKCSSFGFLFFFSSKNFSVHVSVEMPFDIKQIESPTHKIKIKVRSYTCGEHAFTGLVCVSPVPANSQRGYSGAMYRRLPWLWIPASGGVGRDPRPSHVGGGGRPRASCEYPQLVM